MVVERRNYEERSTQRDLNKLQKFIGEMAERFKAVDCKSIEFLIVGSNPTFSFYLTKYGAVGSAPALGAGGHVFKSHYFELVFLFANK